MTLSNRVAVFSLGIALILAVACSEEQAEPGTGQVGGGAGDGGGVGGQDSGAGGQDSGVGGQDSGGGEAAVEGITLLAPIEDLTTLAAAQDPSFRWSKGSFAKYEVTVQRKSGGDWGLYFSKKDTAENLCPGSECSLKTGLNFYAGKYRWWVANGSATVTSETATFESTVADPAKADIDVVGPEVTIGRGAKTPSIAVDATGTPHVVAYHKNGADDLNVLRMYNKGADGNWTDRELAKTEFGASSGNAEKLDASRIFIPDIVIDAENRGWVYARVANQEGGSLLGHSVWRIEGLQSPAPQIVKYKHFDKDGTYGRQGNLSLDPFQPGFVFMAVGSKVSSARWRKLDLDLNEVGSGDISMGPTGEKFRFEISPREGKAGVMHLVGLGDTELPNLYQNSVRANGGGESVPWLPMGDFGGDFTHPSVGIDSSNPLIAYVGVQTSIAGHGVRINIWDGTKMLFDVNSAPRFDGPADGDPAGNGEGRFGPQWAPAKGGGAFLCWTSPEGKIKIRYVRPSPNENDFGQTVEITDGIQCSMATDSNGDIHLVYGQGDMKYRKIVTK